METREQRGVVIAALCKLKKEGHHWLVPSQTGRQGIYRVDADHKHCTCPDYLDRQEPCKHVYAVQYTIRRELNADGTVTDTRTITFTEKKTYTQNWPAYNAAQSSEKDRFQALLCDLCRGIPEPI